MHAAALIPVYVLMLADQLRAPDSHIITVSVVPEQACPASRQVTEALSARLPGVVLPSGQAARPGMVRLAVTVDATGVRIDLADPEGTPLLHRALPARGPAECAALADTIALIIERYWREVGYDAPPLQAAAPPPPPAPPLVPPPPRAPEPAVTPAATVEKQARRAERPPTAAVPLALALAAGVAARTGDPGARDAAMLSFTLEGRIGIRLSAGVSTGAGAPLEGTGQAAFRRFPLRLGAYWPVPLGVGQLEPGVGVDLDLISLSIPKDGTQLRSPSSCSGGLCRSAGADLSLGWSIASTHHVYLRALARAGLSTAYDFVTGTNGDPVWRTPSTYLEVAVESGLRFP